VQLLASRCGQSLSGLIPLIRGLVELRRWFAIGLLGHDLVRKCIRLLAVLLKSGNCLLLRILGRLLGCLLSLRSQIRAGRLDLVGSD
jgi:hypothetical protein